VYGNTYPIKNQLKNLGFFWFKSKKAWGLNRSRYNSQIENRLQQLGVQIPGAQPPAETPESEETGSEESIYVTESENFKNGRWVSEDPDLERSYGFPINEGIHTFDVLFKEGEEEHVISVSIDRKAQPKESSGYYGDTYYKRPPANKRNPLYVFKIIDKETGQVISTHSTVNKKSFSDEENFIVKAEENFGKIIRGEGRLRTKNIRGMIVEHFDMHKRTDELKDYLFKDEGEWRKEVRGFTIDIQYKDEDGDYTGTYPIKVDLTSYDKNLNTPISFDIEEDLDLMDDKKRYNKMLGNGDLVGVYTVEDFNERVKSVISENHESISAEYIKFLKSFPFLESQKEVGKESANEIYGLITGGGQSNDFFLQQLKERGYIRPNKRQKQNVGLATPEAIKWVVDSEKIKDAIYGSGYLHKVPEFFYAVIAYWVHRKKNNIPVNLGSRMGWDQLSSAMDTWMRSMKSFGYEIDWKEVESAVEGIGSQIYADIVGKARPDINPETVFNGEQQGIQFDPNIPPFIQFAEENGVDTTNAVEENRLKSVYLNLAKQFHPDLNRESEEQEAAAQARSKRLMELWQAIPNNIREAAFNLAFRRFAQKNHK
jgi:hypothetical protein